MLTELGHSALRYMKIEKADFPDPFQIWDKFKWRYHTRIFIYVPDRTCVIQDGTTIGRMAYELKRERVPASLTYFTPQMPRYIQTFRNDLRK